MTYNDRTFKQRLI